MIGSTLFPMNENLIMKGALALFDKNGDDVEVIMSPIMFAAWLGFLITFLNLLPAWQLDGGHMSRVILDENGISTQHMQVLVFSITKLLG